MSVATAIASDPERDLEVELDELRRNLLPTLLPGALVLGWLWSTFAAWHNSPLIPYYLPGVAAALAVCGAHWLHARHFAFASFLFLCGMVAADVLVAAVYPGPLPVAFGILIIIVSDSLLTMWGTLAMVTILCVAQGAARRWGLVGAESGWSGLEMAILYYLAWITAWLVRKPLRTAVEWALAGWAHARASLAETRERRAELYRVVRALEEATYRIQRMNNELLVARREAEEARALKARFAATVSHELRGPLSLILGFSRFMALSPERYGEPLPAAYRADVDAIYRASQHMLNLVDDVLDLSQIEAGRMPLVKSRIDLESEVVEKTIDLVQPLAARKGLYLRKQLAGGLPATLADPVRLSQALLNLLTNAVRFTEHGGITVRTARVGDTALISVEDTGPGIAPDQIPNLFKEFYRVQVTETREAGGTGLGLSICKHLIELHGGEIGIESALGRGTTFTLRLPLCPEKTGGEPGVQVRALHETAEPPCCLVVHDNPSLVRTLARYLEGYRVVGMPDEQDLVGITEELHPHAIITTHDAAQHIVEQLSHTPYDVPVISCTMPRPALERQLQGAISYLIKPTAPEIVASVMRQVERNGETTVMLVDDDPDAVRLLEHMLMPTPRPYRIIRAYDGEQALDLMGKMVPDVVFLDLVMPGLDGHEVIARMRSDERLAGVPVVIVSARDCVDEGLSLESPLRLHYRDPLDIAEGARCLLGLLGALSPRYLPGPESPPEPAGALPQ